MMDAADPSPIDQPWPEDGLEPVDSCPYCGKTERTVAHVGVQDWSFFSAPGKWTYWKCTPCESLYLSPRPTRTTVGSAYRNYYTHQRFGRRSFLEGFKERLRNECWSHWHDTNLSPRLHLHRWLRSVLQPLRSRLVEPFELAELHRLPRGRLIDVGCGNGLLLRLAQQLGWRATGLEIDPAAVKVAQSRGLDVLEGSYERLEEFHGSLDAIICSHVLEHVHDPQDMLLRLAGALKSGGTLLLSLPNATSLLREKFGNDWRGLEAPRHLTIPSMRQLQAHLQQLGFTARQREFTLPWTAAESSRIRRRDTRLTTEDRSVQQSLTRSRVFSNIQQYDFIELICIKDVSR